MYSKHWKSSEFDLKGDGPDTRLTAKITDHCMGYFLNETMVYRRAFKPQHFACTSDHFGAPKRPRNQRGDFGDGNLRSTSRGQGRSPKPAARKLDSTRVFLHIDLHYGDFNPI